MAPNSRVPASPFPLGFRLPFSICNEVPKIQLTLKMSQLNFWSSTQNPAMDFLISAERKSIFPGSQDKDVNSPLPIPHAHLKCRKSYTSEYVQDQTTPHRPHCCHRGPRRHSLLTDACSKFPHTSHLPFHSL